jgi:hypothetical protein
MQFGVVYHSCKIIPLFRRNKFHMLLNINAANEFIELKYRLLDSCLESRFGEVEIASRNFYLVFIYILQCIY